MESSLLYVIEKYKPETILIQGSSYTASWVFVLGAKYENDVDGIMAFSSYEDFKFDKIETQKYAETITCPSIS